MNANVTFPSGTVRTVNTLTLLAQTQHAEGMAKFGIPLTRNAPTLKVLRETYEFSARTWKDAAPLMRRFYTDLTAHIDAVMAERNA